MRGRCLPSGLAIGYSQVLYTLTSPSFSVLRSMPAIRRRMKKMKSTKRIEPRVGLVR